MSRVGDETLLILCDQLIFAFYLLFSRIVIVYLASQGQRIMRALIK